MIKRQNALSIWAITILSVLLTVTTIHSTEASRKSPKFYGDVVLVRGGFDVFSYGLDDIAKRLSQRGIKSRIYRHRQVDAIVASILKNQRKNRRQRPIILIGHSWGANAIIKVAGILKGHGLKVRYMATLAATNPGAAPTNIQELSNYYFKENGWGKPVRKARGFKGRLKNIDMSTTSGVHHFNVTDQPKLQASIVNKVVRLTRGRAYANRRSDASGLQLYPGGVVANPEG